MYDTVSETFRLLCIASLVVRLWIPGLSAFLRRVDPCEYSWWRLLLHLTAVADSLSSRERKIE